jgi:hypothetical protein
MDDQNRDRKDQPRDRLNYLREEIAKLRERIEHEAARERRHANLPYDGPDRRQVA